jgi:hypothetical protein
VVQLNLLSSFYLDVISNELEVICKELNIISN